MVKNNTLQVSFEGIISFNEKKKYDVILLMINIDKQQTTTFNITLNFMFIF